MYITIHTLSHLPAKVKQKAKKELKPLPPKLWAKIKSDWEPLKGHNILLMCKVYNQDYQPCGTYIKDLEIE